MIGWFSVAVIGAFRSSLFLFVFPWEDHDQKTLLRSKAGCVWCCHCVLKWWRSGYGQVGYLALVL